MRPLVTLLVLCSACATAPGLPAEPTEVTPPPELAEVAPVPEVPAAQQEQAREEVREGVAAFRVGAYAEAEKRFREALKLNPTSAQASLGLGRVVLIQGSAAGDQAAIESARLMFEAALTQDPNLKEARVLLMLFEEQ